MARKKNLKVDEAVHRESGIRYEIFLTPDNTFVTVVLGRTIHGVSAEDVSKAAWSFINESTNVQFIPVISLRKVSPFGGRGDATAYVGLAVSRFYYAINASNKLLRLEWEHPEPLKHESLARYSHEFYLGREWLGREGVFRPPVRVGEDTFIPYTDQIWNNVMRLVETINLAYQRVEELLRTPENSMDIFAGTGIPLLGVGEGNDDKVE